MQYFMKGLFCKNCLLFHTFLCANPLAAQPVTSFSPKDEMKCNDESLRDPEIDLLLLLLTNVS